MKINGTIFSKPQQDQLRRAIKSSSTTLNKYNFTLSGFTNASNNLKLIHIIQNAKGRIYGKTNYTVEYYSNESYTHIYTVDYDTTSRQIIRKQFILITSTGKFSSGKQITQNITTGEGNISTLTSSDGIVQITYFNDVEIDE